MPANQQRDRMRADKLRRLAASTSFAAEAETARRLADDIEAGIAAPPVGSPAYFEQWRKFRETVANLHCQLGRTITNPAEVRLIRNLRRYGANPWSLDAETLQRVEMLASRIGETIE
ncbi:hypothetical protein [Nitrobacter sp. TKz-YC01]|uniref:hypothetical protein n=1 Tax=Nitrobacter sp. TKz-YC01 TaxID=3398703 RepID=UPI003A101288